MLHKYESLNSTQDMAIELALEGAEEWTAIMALKQRSGRGRKGFWFSPEGGLYLSVILRPELRPELSTQLTIIAAVAVVKTLIDLGVKPELKWPNDVMVKDKKIAGLLVDSRVSRKKIDYAVLGIGINVNIDIWPSEISATSLYILLKRRLSIEELAEELLKNLRYYYNEDIDMVLKIYNSHRRGDSR